MKEADEEIQKLKKALLSSMALLVVVSSVLVYNIVELNKYKDISGGEYITVEQCNGAYEEKDTGFNFSQYMEQSTVENQHEPPS